MRLLNLFIGILLSSLTLDLSAKSLELSYELLQADIVIATVQESFQQTGTQYSIQSVSKGHGVYALLGERTMKSEGSVSVQGLKPSYFESLQSQKPNKALRSRFDWSKQTLNLEIKGRQEASPLKEGAQDLLSVMYQFAWRKLKLGSMSMWINNGKKLTLQQFTVSDAKPIETAVGHFEVFKLTDNNGEKTIYVAKTAPFVVVKIEMQVEGIRTEQVLRKLSVQY